MTILMATLSCSVLLFCLALENGHMKAYRDESVRLQIDPFGAYGTSSESCIYYPFCYAPVISYVALLFQMCLEKWYSS